MARCGGCGRNAAQVVAGLPAAQRRAALDVAAGDLAVIWLVANGEGFREERYCARCAPVAKSWTDVSCTVCGDGPLLILGEQTTLPGMPTATAVAVRATAYLRGRGWRTRDDGARVCPVCPA